MKYTEMEYLGTAANCFKEIKKDLFPKKLNFSTKKSRLFWSKTVWPEKKLPNVYESCPNIISLEKWKILTPLQKLPENMGYLGKLIVAKGFKKLPKVQKIVQSGHTGWKSKFLTRARPLWRMFCIKIRDAAEFEFFQPMHSNKGCQSKSS